MPEITHHKPPTKKMVANSYDFHDQLNPKLWTDDVLNLEVRVALLSGALAFYDFLKIDTLIVKDIILTGSNAAYNYTRMSDLDVHLIVDYQATEFTEVAKNLFSTKKTLWTTTHDIVIKGYPVEFYVEDSASPVTASGVYSLKRNEWIHHPKKSVPKINDIDLYRRVERYAVMINDLLAGSPSRDEISAIIEKIRNMRKAGLDRGGEFSVENMTFKALRNLGFVADLLAARGSEEDRELSIEGL